MLNKREIAFEAKEDHRILVFNPFTETETINIIAGTKDNKAGGPGSTHNEYLKTLQLMLLKVWVIMFKKCMSLGTIPDGWRKSTIRIQYKGNRHLSDLNLHRRIALECTPFKLFIRFLTQRLTILADNQMPDMQFSRSTLKLHTTYYMM
jgi:hypothetical protein